MHRQAALQLSQRAASVSAACIRSRAAALAGTTVARTSFRPAGVRTFSSSLLRSSHGENDSRLSSRLASELSYERENSNVEQTEPDFLQAFKSNGVWTIEDKAGADEIALKRKFGNEEIRVLFSIADIDNSPESSAAENEEGESDAAEASEESEGSNSDQDASLPIRTAITITKGKGAGALTIDAVAQDGMFLVDNVTLYPDEQVANELTPDADWKRRGLYMGPAFDHLDEALQTDFESFLEERGVDSNLALFIPDLAEYKEQKEYVKWLDGVRKFVEA